MGSCLDLRKYQDGAQIQDAFSMIVSGRMGYKAVLERKRPNPKCNQCGRGGDEGQKFCNQCGGKMLVPLTNCPGCSKGIEEIDKFCMNCGHKLKE